MKVIFSMLLFLHRFIDFILNVLILLLKSKRQSSKLFDLEKKTSACRSRVNCSGSAERTFRSARIDVIRRMNRIHFTVYTPSKPTSGEINKKALKIQTFRRYLRAYRGLHNILSREPGALFIRRNSLKIV